MLDFKSMAEEAAKEAKSKTEKAPISDIAKAGIHELYLRNVSKKNLGDYLVLELELATAGDKASFKHIEWANAFDDQDKASAAFMRITHIFDELGYNSVDMARNLGSEMTFEQLADVIQNYFIEASQKVVAPVFMPVKIVPYKNKLSVGTIPFIGKKVYISSRDQQAIDAFNSGQMNDAGSKPPMPSFPTAVPSLPQMPGAISNEKPKAATESDGLPF